MDKSRKLHHINQVFATVAATIGAFGLGTVLGYSAQGVRDLDEFVKSNTTDFKPLTSEIKSWIGSIPNLGAVCSAIFSGILVDWIGRKMTMLLLSLPFVIGWLVIAFARNYGMLIAGRFVTGFCGGGFSLVAPLFIGETSEDGARGALGTGYQFMVTFGVVFSYTFGSFLSYAWLAILCGFVPMLFLAVIIFIPESFRFLIAKDRMEEAKVSFCWFRRISLTEDVDVNVNVEHELEMIKINEHTQEEKQFKDLFQLSHFHPSAILVALLVFQQLSGVNALVFYTGDIFGSAGSTMSYTLSTVIVGLVQFLGTGCAIPLVDRVGRKILLLISSAGTCISLLVLGIYVQLQEDEIVDLNDKSTGWLPLVCVMVFMSTFAVGYGPIPFVMLGELLPAKVKSRVATIALMVNWTLSFVITKFFDAFKEKFSFQVCCWLFSSFGVLGFVFLVLFLPETKRKSLESIQRSFERSLVVSV